MSLGNPPVARPLFPSTGEASPVAGDTQPVASVRAQGDTGPPTADISQSALWYTSPLYESRASAAPSRIRTGGTSEAATGQGSDSGAGPSRQPQQGSTGPGSDSGAGPSRPPRPGSASPGSAVRPQSIDFHNWQGTPFSDDYYSILDSLPSQRGPSDRGRRRQPSYDLYGYPDTPFRTSDTVPDLPPARRPANALRGSSFAFSFPAPGTNTGQFLDTTALHSSYGRFAGATSGQNTGRIFRSPFLQSTEAPITVEGVGDIQTTPENAMRLLRPTPQRMDRGTSPGEHETNPLLDSQVMSDAPDPEEQDVSLRGGAGYPGFPPPGTPPGSGEPPSQARRRGKKIACCYIPPYKTPLDRLRETATTPGEDSPPAGERHPPGVEEVTGEFLGFVAKCCGALWTCPCTSVAACCEKAKCPERCGQAYSTVCGEACAQACRDECPAGCQPEQCASLCRECGQTNRYCQDIVTHPENRACVTCVSSWCCLAFTMTCTQVLAPWIVHCLQPWPFG